MQTVIVSGGNTNYANKLSFVDISKLVFRLSIQIVHTNVLRLLELEYMMRN